jgi:hypothetical protein
MKIEFLPPARAELTDALFHITTHRAKALVMSPLQR